MRFTDDAFRDLIVAPEDRVEYETGLQCRVGLIGDAGEEQTIVDLNGPSAEDWKAVARRIETRWPLTDVRLCGRAVQFSFGGPPWNPHRGST